MPAYVRIRNHAEFRRAVEAAGTQTEVAARAGVSLQRLSQLVVGTAPVIRATSAAAIEQTLGVPQGSLFAADEPDLMRAYLAGDDEMLDVDDEVLDTEPA